MKMRSSKLYSSLCSLRKQEVAMYSVQSRDHLALPVVNQGTGLAHFYANSL